MGSKKGPSRTGLNRSQGKGERLVYYEEEVQVKVNKWEKQRSGEASKSHLLLAGIMGLVLVVLLLIYVSIPRVPSGRNQEMPGLQVTPTRSVRAIRENLRLSPNGTKIGELLQEAELEVLEDRGAWLRVRVEGWIWKESTSLSSS
jgi:hypothetical protein